MADPHDRFFRKVFSDPECALAHLRRSLPSALVDTLDLPRGEAGAGVLLDEELAERRADLLWRIPFRPDLGEACPPLHLHLLFEHQSTPDAVMALRLNGYVQRIWERWLHEEARGLPLPPVLPVVLYQGERPWTQSERLAELVDVPEEAAPWLDPHTPDFRFVLQDLSAVSDDELRHRALDGLALLLMKHIRDRNLLEQLPRWSEVFQRVLRERPEGLKAIELVVEYLLQARGDVATEAIVTTIGKTGGTEAETRARSVADRLREEGRQEGRQEGMRTLVERAFERRAGAFDAEARARIEAADAATLRRWFDELLAGRTPDELTSDDG